KRQSTSCKPEQPAAAGTGATKSAANSQFLQNQKKPAPEGAGFRTGNQTSMMIGKIIGRRLVRSYKKRLKASRMLVLREAHSLTRFLMHFSIVCVTMRLASSNSCSDSRT